MFCTASEVDIKKSQNNLGRPISPPLWLRCNMLCRPTPYFVDDVIFSYNGPYGGVMLRQQPRCSVCTA